MPSVLVDRVTKALGAGAEELLRRQRPDGAFTDTPPASTLGTAGAIVALHVADRTGSASLIERGAAWLIEQQHPDGGWGGVTGADSEPVATAVATAALRITDPTGSASAVEAGRRHLRETGGVAAVTDMAVAHLCRQMLALAGLPEAGTVRRLPLEIVLFDDVRRRRISFRTAPFVALALLQTRTMPVGGLRRITQRRAVPRALQLLESIDEHEGHTGDFSEDPWPTALVCLGLATAGLAPHLVASTAGFLRRSVRPDGAWDAVTNLDLTRSAFAAVGLLAAGYAADPRLARTRELFHRTQQRRPFTILGIPAGGWSYCCGHGWPVTLESSEIISALTGFPGATEDSVLRDGTAWLLDRQDSRGSWSLWVRDTRLANDGPCPGLTSQGITALRDAGHGPDSPPVAAAARWLLTQQRPDGTFENLWYRDATVGTAVVLDALVLAGHAAHPVARLAAGWLVRQQLDDGSWGPGGGVPGSVEETAWAVHALLSAGRADPDGPAAAPQPVERGVDRLLELQQPDGGWQPSRVCAYIRHHMHYPNGALARGLTLKALAAYRRDRGASA